MVCVILRLEGLLLTLLWYMREEVTGNICSVKFLFFNLCIGLPNALFPSGFQTRTLYEIAFSPCMPHTTCPNPLIHDLISPIIFAIQIVKWCNFLQSPVTSSLLGPNNFLSTMFPKAVSLCCSFCVSDQVSHPCTAPEKFMVLHLLVFMFLDGKLEDKWLWTKCCGHSLILICS